MGIILDVTEQKRAAAELRETNALLQALLEAVAAADHRRRPRRPDAALEPVRPRASSAGRPDEVLGEPLPIVPPGRHRPVEQGARAGRRRGDADGRPGAAAAPRRHHHRRQPVARSRARTGRNGQRRARDLDGRHRAQPRLRAAPGRRRRAAWTALQARSCAGGGAPADLRRHSRRLGAGADCSGAPAGDAPPARERSRPSSPAWPRPSARRVWPSPGFVI